MSEDIGKYSSIGISQASNSIGVIAKSFAVSKEIHELGSAVRSIIGATQIWLNSDEFRRAAELFEVIRFNAVQQFSNPSSELGRALRAVSEVTLALNQAVQRPDSKLRQTLMTIGEIGAAWNATSPRVMTKVIKEHYELYDLIQSGQITAEQVSSGFEEAISRGGTLDVSDGLVTGEARSGALNEIINAFMSAGTLKGVSLPSLRFFIALMITLAWTFGAMNQGFELQKNVGELFTAAKNPAEARLLTRHPPAGVDKEKLMGFRVLIGDRVQLREGPGQKYLAIKQLSVGALLQVLDSSEKSWLMVSVVEDGEVFEGWVLRGYTKPFR